MARRGGGLPTRREAARLFAEWTRQPTRAGAGAHEEGEGQRRLSAREAQRRSNEARLFSTPLSDAQLLAFLREVQEEGVDAGVQGLGAMLTEAQFLQLLREKRMRDVFDSMDADGSQEIDAAELKNALRALGFRLATPEIHKILREIDTDHNGSISFQEFRTFFARVPHLSLETIGKAMATTAGIDVGSDLSAPLPSRDDMGSAHGATGSGANEAGATSGAGAAGNKGPQLWHFVLAGGAGGVVSRTVTAPAERIKLQSQVLGSNASMWSMARKVVQTEGLRGLFAGNAANCARVFPFGGLVCLSYSQLLRVLPADDQLDPMEPFWRALAGAGAGLSATVMTYPLDIVRVRLALQHVDAGGTLSSAQKHSFKYRGVLHALTSLVREEGIRGLYRGMGPSLAAMVPFVAMQQSFYDILKASAVDYLDASPSPMLFLGCGAAAGAAAQSVVFPLDLVRRRLQMDTGATGPSATSSLSRLIRGGGVRALFSGITPSLAKVMPAVAISVSVRDSVKAALHRRA